MKHENKCKPHYFQEEEEYEDEPEYQEGEPQEPSTEAPPSSTEGKKLVGNGVRPFRSNTDLLEALKRRRAQAAEGNIIIIITIQNLMPFIYCAFRSISILLNVLFITSTIKIYRKL